VPGTGGDRETGCGSLVGLPSHRDQVARRGGSRAAAAAVACATVAFVASLTGWLAGGWAVDLPWAPTLGLRLDLSLDGLGAMYALLATGIGAAVFAYGSAYLPLHLEHERRPASEARRFWGWMVLFMVSMVGLACARDLVLLFVFFHITAVA
jgi:multicomponent Na+:H+ antiporter subunit A